MARPGVAGRKIIYGDEEVDAASIKTFCRRHGLSVATYYNLRVKGLTPREAVVAGRRLITREAAEQWRRAREGFAATGNSNEAA
jgi:hypothetical protein